MRFRDRTHAGRLLAASLSEYIGGDVVVLGLPRGGVPVAHEVARALGATLDVMPVRKLGLPGHEELALGAIAPGGVRVVNGSVAHAAGVGDDAIDALVELETHELARQEQLYRGNRAPATLAGRTVILVDDGLATGASMRAAALAAAGAAPREIVAAVPVAAASTAKGLSPDVDRVVSVLEPRRFLAVGYWYDDFEPTSDAEVQALLTSTLNSPNLVTQRRSGSS